MNVFFKLFCVFGLRDYILFYGFYVFNKEASLDYIWIHLNYKEPSNIIEVSKG